MHSHSAEHRQKTSTWSETVQTGINKTTGRSWKYRTCAAILRGRQSSLRPRWGYLGMGESKDRRRRRFTKGRTRKFNLSHSPCTQLSRLKTLKILWLRGTCNYNLRFLMPIFLKIKIIILSKKTIYFKLLVEWPDKILHNNRLLRLEMMMRDTSIRCCSRLYKQTRCCWVSPTDVPL